MLQNHPFQYCNQENKNKILKHRNYFINIQRSFRPCQLELKYIIFSLLRYFSNISKRNSLSKSSETVSIFSSSTALRYSFAPFSFKKSSDFLMASKGLLLATKQCTSLSCSTPSFSFNLFLICSIHSSLFSFVPCGVIFISNHIVCVLIKIMEN